MLKPLGTTPDEITAICRDANYDDRCAGLVVWLHTFSPAKMWINGLTMLNKPLLQFHTQFTLDEVGLLLEVTAKTVCAQYLHGAEQYEVTKLGIEITFVHRLIFTQRFYILFQKLLTQAVGIIGFGLP